MGRKKCWRGIVGFKLAHTHQVDGAGQVDRADNLRRDDEGLATSYFRGSSQMIRKISARILQSKNFALAAIFA